MKKDLILIDGNSLLFRAYFAMRPMVTASGIHTQGIFAFINMLSKITNDYNPDYIAVAFDLKDKTFRHLEYAEYKAGRQSTPIELLSEIPYLHKVLEAMNIQIFEKSGFEADDLIGTIAARASSNGMSTLVISGDKDELQLVDEHINVLINKKGMSEFQVYDIEAMKERYGLTPKQFIDLKGLMGDKSDNIPGVPGIGEKKGMALLTEYGSLEAVIENAENIKGKLGENLRANIESAVMSKWLATIKTDCPIEFEWEDLKFEEPNVPALIDIYKELEFKKFIEKLQSDMLDANESVSNDVTIDVESVEIVDLQTFLSRVENESEVVIELLTDANHLAEPEVEAVSLYSEKNNLFACKSLTVLDVQSVLHAIAEKNYRLLGSDVKRIIYSAIATSDTELSFKHDTNIAEYLIYPNQNKYSLAKMLLKYCSYMTTSEEEAYTGEVFNMSYDIASEQKLLARSIMIQMIASKQREVLDEQGLAWLFDECEMPLASTLAAIEFEGIKIDPVILNQIGSDIKERVSELEASIYEDAGETFNINSPKQLGKILFETMGLPYPKKKTATSSYSTAADILDKLSGEYDIVSNVLEYRKLTKLASTYVDGLLSLEGSDGKIHPHFMQTVAATGRLSCTEPNLQNIPIRDDYGRLIRKAFVVSDEDNVFTGADYSQIELRVLAALSGDENLINAFNEGKDIHRTTAARVFNIPFDEVTANDRTRAKAVNFGVIYGMSGFGLGESLGITKKEAEKYIEDYFNSHVAVKEYLDRMVALGEAKREVRTHYGRIRQIPEFESRKFMEIQLAKRLAMNTPIQGTAADIIKIAMNDVHKALKTNNLKSKLILQIHDELIIEGPREEADEVRELLSNCMESAADLAVKLTVDINSASNWYELK